LIYWGKPEVVIPVRGGPWWDGARVGAGLPPIETKAGWLVIYHGVKYVVGDPVYRLGAALLDLNEPHRLIGRTRRWLLSPSEPYERLGDAPNVLFACGGFVRGDDLWIYYGAADSSICLAKAKFAEVLDNSTRLPKRVRARRNNRPLIGVFRDADGDGAVNIGDPVYLINYVFKSGPPPVEPCCP
jgi:predicted GH43/DUF377 family glycosyl hydrolase